MLGKKRSGKYLNKALSHIIKPYMNSVTYILEYWYSLEWTNEAEGKTDRTQKILIIKEDRHWHTGSLSKYLKAGPVQANVRSSEPTFSLVFVVCFHMSFSQAEIAFFLI